MKLQWLRELRVKNANLENAAREHVTDAVTGLPAYDGVEVDESKGMGAKPSARFSALYETVADYARALIRYAWKDGLGLTIKDGRLVISIGSKSDGDLLGELRAHETAVMDILREGRAKGAISIRPAQPAEAFRPPIVRVPPFGCDTVPERFRAAWEAILGQCPTGVRPIIWQAAISDAADLFSYWGLQLVSLGFTPGDVFEVPRHD